MEKNRNSKIIVIIALIIGIAGLSLGFAAFSNNLTISSSANVSPNADTFKVLFSSSETALETAKITGVASSQTGVTTGEATIVNTGTTPKITGLSAGFTNPGENVMYTFYAYNSGEYEAFLKSITYGTVTGGKTKVCTAVDSTNTSQTLVDKACNDISLTVKVGNITVTDTEESINQSLAKKSFVPIVITIAYANNGNRADGDFTVSFGDVTLSYASA